MAADGERIRRDMRRREESKQKRKIRDEKWNGNALKEDKEEDYRGEERNRIRNEDKKVYKKEAVEERKGNEERRKKHVIIFPFMEERKEGKKKGRKDLL